MEKALTKVGSFWMSQKAKQEISHITDDLSSLSSMVEEKAKWLINKLKGKPSKTWTDLLRDYHLPPGLFPQNVTCHEFDETRDDLIVYLPSPWEVCFKNSSVVRHANRVKATLLRGKLTAIEGMKTKVLLWVKMTGIDMHHLVLSSLGRETVYLNLFAVSSSVDYSSSDRVFVENYMLLDKDNIR